MACDKEELKHVPLFTLLDDEEAAVLAAQVEVRQFASELDFDVNRRAESEIQGVAEKLNLLSDKIGDVDDLRREKLR